MVRNFFGSPTPAAGSYTSHNYVPPNLAKRATTFWGDFFSALRFREVRTGATLCDVGRIIKMSTTTTNSHKNVAASGLIPGRRERVYAPDVLKMSAVYAMLRKTISSGRRLCGTTNNNGNRKRRRNGREKCVENGSGRYWIGRNERIKEVANGARMRENRSG